MHINKDLVMMVYSKDYEELFFKRLSQLRLEKGISQRDMSLSLGQNANYINGIESKRNFPSMTLFFYICDYLGVTPMEFFDFDNKYPLMSSDLMNIIKSLNKNSLEPLTIIAKALKESENKK